MMTVGSATKLSKDLKDAGHVNLDCYYIVQAGRVLWVVVLIPENIK